MGEEWCLLLPVVHYNRVMVYPPLTSLVGCQVRISEPHHWEPSGDLHHHTEYNGPRRSTLPNAARKTATTAAGSCIQRLREKWEVWGIRVAPKKAFENTIGTSKWKTATPQTLLVWGAEAGQTKEWLTTQTLQGHPDDQSLMSQHQSQANSLGQDSLGTRSEYTALSVINVRSFTELQHQASHLTDFLRQKCSWQYTSWFGQQLVYLTHHIASLLPPNRLPSYYGCAWASLSI